MGENIFLLTDKIYVYDRFAHTKTAQNYANDISNERVKRVNNFY